MNFPIVRNPTLAERKAAKDRKGFFLRRDPAFRLLTVQLFWENLPLKIKRFWAKFTFEPLQVIDLFLCITHTEFRVKVPAYMDCFGSLFVEADEKAFYVGKACDDPDRNQRIGNGGQLYVHAELQYPEGDGRRRSVWSGIVPIFSEKYPKTYPNKDRKMQRRSVKIHRQSPRRMEGNLQLPAVPTEPLSPPPSPVPQDDSFPSSPSSLVGFLATPPVDAQSPDTDPLPDLYAALRVSATECLTP